MNTYNIKFPKGDTFTFKVSLKDKTQSIDSAYFTVREYANQDVLLQKKLNQGITQIDDGLYRIQIESFDTKFLDIGVRYIFDLTFKCETVVKTILYGGLTLLPKLSEGEEETILDGIEAKIAEKQDKLESGVTIKTINDESILGSGNLKIKTTEFITNDTSTRVIMDWIDGTEVTYTKEVTEVQVSIRTQPYQGFISGLNFKTGSNDISVRSIFYVFGFNFLVFVNGLKQDLVLGANEKIITLEGNKLYSTTIVYDGLALYWYIKKIEG